MNRVEDPGVPLAHYIANHPRAGVRIICQGCCASRDVPMAEMLESLKRRGLGDESTGIKAIAGLLTAECPRCGKVYWETRPAF